MAADDTEAVNAARAGFLASAPEYLRESANGLRGSHNDTSRRERLPLLLAREVGRELPNTLQILEDVLCRGDVGVIFGEPEGGKTTCALHVAVSVATGTKCLGQRTARCGVLYIAPESAGVRQRLHGTMRHYGIDDMPLAIVPAPIDLFDGLADVERIIEAAQTLEARTGEKVRLIFDDTLAKSIGAADENASRDMGAVMQNLQHIADATGAAVLAIHHTGKDPSRGGRGSSAIRAAVDVEIEVTHDEGAGVRVLTVRKQRNLGTTGLRLAAKFVRVDIGVDQWGKRQTVSVIETVDVPVDTNTQPKPPRLSDPAVNALAVFDELLGEKGEALATTSITPPGMRGVRVNDWRSRYFYKFRPEPSDDGAEYQRNKDAKRKEFDRARDALIARKVLSTSGEFVWKAGQKTRPP
jgi:hypothetical protein